MQDPRDNRIYTDENGDQWLADENGATISEIGNQMWHNSEETTKIYARMNNTVIQKIESHLEQIMRTMKSKDMYIKSENYNN